MKIAIIAPQNSIHTVRWVNSLVLEVGELHLLTMHSKVEDLHPDVVVHNLKYKAPLGYFFNFVQLKKLVKKISPDLIHTHFMSGYGTLAALSIKKDWFPHLISMWGSDIYIFPDKSKFHRRLIKWIADNATSLASTSTAMRKRFFEVYPDYNKTVSITPFGVDTNLFAPQPSLKKKGFHIGIAKNLEDKYGINYLIESFDKFSKSHDDSWLHIIGAGSKTKEIKALGNICENSERIIFYGRVPNIELPNYINAWDVCVLPSLSESFGVSAVEASSCELPVVVTKVGGLPEVVEDGKTGFIVPARDADAIAEKLKILYYNKELREELGRNGREKVLKEYKWEKNVETMVQLYRKLMLKS